MHAHSINNNNNIWDALILFLYMVLWRCPWPPRSCVLFEITFVTLSLKISILICLSLRRQFEEIFFKTNIYCTGEFLPNNFIVANWQTVPILKYFVIETSFGNILCYRTLSLVNLIPLLKISDSWGNRR